jgi:hypothetical protein
VSIDAADLALLRRFEPIVKYTYGELFFPTGVEGYFAECDLFVGASERERRLLVPQGSLTVDRLVSHIAPPGENLYLRLVQAPLTGLDLGRWNRRPDRQVFHAPGRLARVGLFARLVDAGFTASLLLRGTVPGGTAAAAQIKYERARAADPAYHYHARVVRQDGWLVLHYMWFYFMNDFRSTFAGANDHEADWEQAFIYLEEPPKGEPRPVWIACAAHDYTGDDLRRRWDDPLLVKEGDHPVLHAGAGSHASYFEQGEYLTIVPLPALRGVKGLLGAIRDLWRDILRQPDPGDLATSLESALAVPFIDYARADGLAIGPGQPAEWAPVTIDDSTDWVDGYRGLFGLDTRDRFAGERAPAGPKYGRAGTVRQSWNDPVGFAGLSKVAPPYRQPAILRERLLRLRRDLVEADAQVARDAEALPPLEAEVGALSVDASLSSIHDARRAELVAAEQSLRQRRSELARLRDTIGALELELQRVEHGDLGAPTAHLHHAMHPMPPDATRYGRLVEFWSAISIGILLLAEVAMLVTGIVPWYTALFVGFGGYVLVEAAFRRRLTQLLLRLTLLLAVVSIAILAVNYAAYLIVAAIAALALIVLTDNVREIRR